MDQRKNESIVPSLTQLEDFLTEHDSNVVWLLVATILSCGWIIYLTYYNSRNVGLILTLVLNRLHKRGYIHIGSFSFSVLSGKVMVREIYYITEDMSIRIQDGFIIFRWWKMYNPKQKQHDPKAETRLSITINDFEFHVYNRSDLYGRLQELFGLEPTIISPKKEDDRAQDRGRIRTRSGMERVSVKTESQDPASSWRSLIPVVKVSVSTGRLAFGNHYQPQTLCVSVDDAFLTYTTKPPSSHLDQFMHIVKGRLENVRVMLVPSPRYVGLQHDEPPRLMGEGFVVMHSNDVDVYYYMDEPGLVPEDAEDSADGEAGSEDSKLQDLPPCWGLDIVCGKGTDFNYGPWADRQRWVGRGPRCPPAPVVQHGAGPGPREGRCGYTPAIKGQLLHVDATTSMQYRALLEAEMLAFHINASYPRVWNMPQTWQCELEVYKATYHFIFAQKHFFTVYLAACGETLTLDFSLPFTDFVPTTCSTKFSVRGDEVDLHLFLPDCHPSKYSLSMLVRSCRARGPAPDAGVPAEGPSGPKAAKPKWRNVTQERAGWVECWTVPSVVLTIDYTWHPIYPQRAEEQLKQSLSEMEETLLSVLRPAQRAPARENYFGEDDVYMDFEEAASSPVVSLSTSSSSGWTAAGADSDRQDSESTARSLHPLALRPWDITVLVNLYKVHGRLPVHGTADGPECPSAFLERLCFEMKKGLGETMLQLVLSPLNVFVSDNHQRPAADESLREGHISLSGLQLRAHAMFSAEGLPLGSDSLEYAWLIDVQAGNLTAKVTAPQEDERTGTGQHGGRVCVGPSPPRATAPGCPGTARTLWFLWPEDTLTHRRGRSKCGCLGGCRFFGGSSAGPDFFRLEELTPASSSAFSSASAESDLCYGQSLLQPGERIVAAGGPRTVDGVVEETAASAEPSRMSAFGGYVQATKMQPQSSGSLRSNAGAEKGQEIAAKLDIHRVHGQLRGLDTTGGWSGLAADLSARRRSLKGLVALARQWMKFIVVTPAFKGVSLHRPAQPLRPHGSGDQEPEDGLGLDSGGGLQSDTSADGAEFEFDAGSFEGNGAHTVAERVLAGISAKQEFLYVTPLSCAPFRVPCVAAVCVAAVCVAAVCVAAVCVAAVCAILASACVR
ncbi:PREDICTED: uncharacterized protein KIAA1109 [Condylura cristata]|uniref:uncharacterized protein KIAA1109 n=1 Tax=Condylura cristata TaxID=143302 RepID=UPI000643760E|nr:PREDICTED: uncharacterized protein KIAA1109 [Condylura cristata]